MKRPVTVTRTAISSRDTIGRLYVMLFRHFFDAETGVKVGCKGFAVTCQSTEQAWDVMEEHRQYGLYPTTH
ncbi:hypothetical protein PSP6_540005 [Paraburkholderia tropica]|uniref:hypothetical protein n=1 Tax=Paraburkholderia tropica TaxID=92647 RepID=UPI001CB22F63|nr:hypothetical protein [Paraburkholderia tropica]CAG9229860.1 hypothetical protein PSP6_540005 [Paraburkholderia tropica]